MGMNYYLKSVPCPLCQHCKDERHIGKSSGGWRFYFRGYNDVKSYADWQDLFNDMKYQIVDEDGDVVTSEFVHELIQSCIGMKNHHNVFHGKPENNAEWEYVYNYSQRLPFTECHPDANWKDEDGHPFTSQEFK